MSPMRRFLKNSSILVLLSLLGWASPRPLHATRRPQAPSQPAQSLMRIAQVVCVHGETAAQGQTVGSGFVVAPGYILTSGHGTDHVIRLSVQFHNRSASLATLLAVSSTLDLALLRIADKSVPPIPFGEDHSEQVGDPVRAVGCPFDLNHSVSQGIISAPERTLMGRDVLQTDVAVNPGNSGGPLLNKQGEVLGVVLGILSEARGISFSLPVREARRFLGETFLQMGILFAEEKRYTEAVDALSHSTHFWPRSAHAFNNLGEAYRRGKKPEKAGEAYLKALEIDPKYADAHYNLGIFYDTVLHDSEKAAHYYRRYLVLKPSSPEATQVGRWLAAFEKGNRVSP